MPQWGNTDVAANSVIWGPAQVNKAANTTNRNALYGNTTPDAFVAGQIVGVYGASSGEVTATTASLFALRIVTPGSGYLANTTVTISGNATGNATSTAGRISALNLSNTGSGYTTAPTVAITAPTAISFNANTAVDGTTDFISIASNVLQNNDRVKYLVATGNTALAGLANNTNYFVIGANSTGVKLATTPGGTNLELTKGLTETGHSFTGETATAIAVVTGGARSPGWILRREGTGGRVGRVTHETLVAMHNVT